MQSRVVTDPIVDPLIGWWKEYFYFHVPFSAMCTEHMADPSGGYFAKADLVSMLTDTTYDLASDYGESQIDPDYFAYKGGVNWMKATLQSAVMRFFRDETDQDSSTKLDRYPGAYLDRQHGLQSLLSDTQVAAAVDEDLPGVDDIEDQNVLDDFATEFDKFQILRDAGFVKENDYDAWLRAQGAPGVPAAGQTSPDGQELVFPELVGFHRKWTYPTNHVDPTNGAPTSACSWSIVERGDKAMQFKEPGFLICLTVTRPKVYLGSLKGSLTGGLTTFKGFPSMVFKDHPYVELIKTTHSTTNGPLINQTTDYWFDVGDLYRFGEQFVNHTPANVLAFPTDIAAGATLADRVPTLSQVKSFFVDAAGTKNFIKEDGVIHWSIKSKLGRDATPGGM
jgi:hypothetical protein